MIPSTTWSAIQDPARQSTLAVAWTAEFSNATGSRARVLPAPNGYARTEWLNSGEGRLSLYQPSDYFDQLDAIDGYASRIGGPSDTRIINVNLVTAWGYMVRGRLMMRTADGEEIYEAGQAFYWAPGHAPVALEDGAYVAFSPTAEVDAVLAHITGA